MLITAITIENFKGIQKPARIELKPITMFFGPNSAGKSTIIQAMHYAHEIFERQNLNPDQTLLGGEAIDLGGFENMAHGHDKTRPIKISFDLDLSKRGLPEYLDDIEYYGLDFLQEASDDLAGAERRVTSAVVQITVTWSDRFEKAYVSEYSVSTNGEKLVNIVSSEDAKQIYISELNNRNPIFFEESLDLEIYEHDFKKDLEDDIKKAVEDDRANTIKAFENDITPEQRAKIQEKFKHTKSCVDLDLVWNEHLNKRILINPNKRIPLSGQSSALPNWGKNLAIGCDLNLHDQVFGEELYIKLNRDRRLSGLITGPGELVRNELRKLCYIGPIRAIPPRGYKPFSSPSSLNRWADGLAAYDVLFNSEEPFLENVNSWMANEDRLSSGYRVEVKKYRELPENHDEDDNLQDLPLQRRLLIRDKVRDIEFSPHDIGVGISQVLPVVVAALHRESGVVAIEQPELHIHPAFQVALGDLFIEQIRQRPDLTFMLETHSEHLMLRFLRRVRETGEKKAPENLTLVPEELSINFIETRENGFSCTQIRVDEDGDFIDRWPKGFFNERFKERY